ncbi:alkaline phosphatase D family protein [Erythrobacter sp.]|jgi:alkaline phosphatase D|uniref:alkaline phosphatase D family protein n=1 Tax=Erythrobacter sp. TaxID=1042 RepID=UPI002EA3651B|nr:alkaline phosphatase D family protein [Erythrobacter sp.]
MIRSTLLAGAMFALAACTAAPGDRMASTASAASSYDGPAGTGALPVAPPNVSLAPDTAITRLAFGSCNHQLRPQAYWSHIAAADPDVFLFIGDNNYGDNGWDGDADLTSLREAYAVQAATPELAAFRARVPMMITWDDHDYGFNDGGSSFAFRERGEALFEAFWDVPGEVRARPGVYHSTITGPPGQRTQIILLDTRFFRSDLATKPYALERWPLGVYEPSRDPAKTMLGEAQWRWLQSELAKPADLRIVASSIQVLTEAHDYESWKNLPLERAKLFGMLAAREESGLVLLSGDRHAGGIYTDAPQAAGGERLWELTSSSLNYSFNTTERNTEREPDARRVTDFISEENFGLVEIDWPARRVTLSLRDAGDVEDGTGAGEVRATRTVEW